MIKKARPGSDLDKERKSTPIIVGVLTLITALWFLCFFVDLGSFNETLRENVKASGTRFLGAILAVAAVVVLWVGVARDWEAKTYAYAWGIAILFGSLLAFGFNNM